MASNKSSPESEANLVVSAARLTFSSNEETPASDSHGPANKSTYMLHEPTTNLGDPEVENTDGQQTPKQPAIKTGPEIEAAFMPKSEGKDTIVSEGQVDEIEDAIDAQYNRRNHGLCVIFTLFTGDLTGYLEDRKAAHKFFSGLGYTVMCSKTFINVTREQLFESIKEVKKTIEEKENSSERPYYDRFVFIILTHGAEGGLMTCAPNSDVLEESDDSKGGIQRVYTKVDEICDKFTHDKIPSLKGVPKLFLIQACRGFEKAKVAGQISSKPKCVQETHDLSNLQLRPEIPIDADQLVYYATTANHESWVSSRKGSWLIEKVLAVFTKHHKTRHVSEMLTTVNFAISNERGETKKGDKVCQMPCIVSTLRMNYFL